MNDFTSACAYVMPLGKHKGKTLARIGSNEEGLCYLDWLIGQDWVNGPLKDALTRYLSHPAIDRLVDEAVQEDSRDGEWSQ